MATDDLTGRVLGEYKLVEIIGRGGMATVYRASDRALNREVAVKVMSSALSHQENYAQRFTQEARTAASLEHIHIVPIYRYGTQDNITYIVMRLLTGGSLAQRIAQRERANQPLPSLREIAEMLRQVASALQFGHDRGIIHRDIKSSNIMFDNNGSAMVVDFGIARLQEATVHMTTSGAQIGTPAYMAPEQWRGENPTPQVDQYALAIVIFNVLSGKLPFEASATHTMMYKHLNEPPPPVHTLAINVPEGISYVLQRALAKDPEERYPTITSFAGAFLDVVAPMHSTNTEFFTYKIRQTSPPGTGTGSRPGSGSGDGSGGRRQTAGGSGSRHPSSLARGRTAQRGTLLPWLIGGGAVAIIAILAFALIAQNQNNNEPPGPATQAVAADVTGTSPAQENSGSVIIITRAPVSQAQLTDEVGAEVTDDAGMTALGAEPTVESSAETEPTATRPPTETSSPTEPPPTIITTREATEGSAALPLVSESSPSPEPRSRLRTHPRLNRQPHPGHPIW
ncbi:MAG: protein kinase [Chloroflexi bacterium]|nr:protein kinase [Chloroflexota bacterium]